MPFPGAFVRAPIMAAKHGMQDAALAGVNDHGQSPVTSVAAAAAGGGSGSAGMLTGAMQPAAPVFSALPTLGSR